MRIKLDVPILCLLFIVMNQFWPLWAELSVSELLYQGCTLILAGLWVLKRRPMLHDKFLFFRQVMFFVWIVMMFMAYQFEMLYSIVSWWGMRLDTHAKIMLYFMLLFIPCMGIFCEFKFCLSKKLKIFMGVIATSNIFYSLRAVALYPDALRARKTLELIGNEDILFGTPGYTVIHSTVLLLPWFLAKAKESDSKKEKAFYIYIFAALLITIVISQFATALITSLISVVIYWAFSEKDAKKRVFRIVSAGTLGIMATVLKEVIFRFFEKLALSITGSWGVKLIEIVTFMSGEGKTGDLATRSKLYEYSFQSFLESPLLGMLGGGKREIGDHSSMLDMLALVGILGTAFFVGALFLTYKKTRKSCENRNFTIAFKVTTIAYLILLFTKNLISALTVNFTFFVLIPILFTMEEKNE